MKLWTLRDTMESTSQADDLPNTVRQFIQLRELHDQIQELLTKFSEAKQHWAYEGIPALFERHGITSYTMKEGYRVGIQTLVRASTRDMEEGIRWCRDHDHGFLVKETINASTLAGYARARAEEGKPDLPSEVFNVHFGMNTSITKVRP